MLNLVNKYQLEDLKRDFSASIVVFLVATPLCLGIALASGAPLFSGIIAGIIGGIVVGAISGSQLGVSGPAAGLAVIVLNAIGALGWETFLLAVLMSGVIQVILGYLHAGIVGYYFPSSVIKGMLAGIGLIIILKQLSYAVGYNVESEDVSQNELISPLSFITEFNNFLGNIQPGAILITIVSLLILILWERPKIKSLSISRVVQGPLLVVVFGIVCNLLLKTLFPSLALQGTYLVQIPIAEGLQQFLSLFTLPDFSAWNQREVYTTALTLAVVASLETLLCVEATDKLDPYKRKTPTNQELKAQGVGNILCGLIGGLPLSQVIVRSSANIQSGGRTKVSAILHGILLLLISLLLPKLLNQIPLASLAAILLVVGYKLANPKIFKKVFSLGKYQFLPFIITVVAILFTDLLTGIGLGFAVALFFILLNNFRYPYEYKIEHDEKEKHHIKIYLSEDLAFWNRASILKLLEGIQPHSKVTIDAQYSINIDHDVLEIIENFSQNAKHKNIDLNLKGKIFNSI